MAVQKQAHAGIDEHQSIQVIGLGRSHLYGEMWAQAYFKGDHPRYTPIDLYTVDFMGLGRRQTPLAFLVGRR